MIFVSLGTKKWLARKITLFRPLASGRFFVPKFDPHPSHTFIQTLKGGSLAPPVGFCLW